MEMSAKDSHGRALEFAGFFKIAPGVHSDRKLFHNAFTGSLVWWARKEYGFGIPCRYPKAIGKYGITAGMSVPNNPRIRGIAWYSCIIEDIFFKNVSFFYYYSY